MEDEKVKIFQEEYPEIFEGVGALIQKKIEERDKGREAGTDALIEVKLRQREFFKALADKIPNWEEVWKSEAFQSFLNRVEEGSIAGLTNYTFVADAFRRLDAPAAIGFFNIFSEGRPRKDSRESSFNPSAMSRETAKRELVKLADEKKKGLWKGREAEYTKRSDALYKIIMSGR